MCRSKKWLLIACGLTAFLIISTHAFAGSRVIFKPMDPSTVEVFFAVPPGKKFILKSFVATPWSAEGALLYITRNNSPVMSLEISGGESFRHNFQNLVFKENEEIRIHNTSQEQVHVTFTGVVK